MLSSSRGSAGMGVGGIPYLTTTGWCRDRGIDDPDDIERVVIAVQALDGIYLQDVVRKLKKQGERGALGDQKSGRPKPGRRGRP